MSPRTAPQACSIASSRVMLPCTRLSLRTSSVFSIACGAAWLSIGFYRLAASRDYHERDTLALGLMKLSLSSPLMNPSVSAVLRQLQEGVAASKSHCEWSRVMLVPDVQRKSAASARMLPSKRHGSAQMITLKYHVVKFILPPSPSLLRPFPSSVEQRLRFSGLWGPAYSTYVLHFHTN